MNMMKTSSVESLCSIALQYEPKQLGPLAKKLLETEYGFRNLDDALHANKKISGFFSLGYLLEHMLKYDGSIFPV